MVGTRIAYRGYTMLRYVKPALAQHISPVFVETGTYTGDGIETALEMGFQRVISIEVFEGFALPAQEKYAEDPRVTVIHGDSEFVLWDAIKDVEDKITFWLDGHLFPECENEESGKTSPLIEELDQISRHPIKDHVILIDDMSSLTGEAYKNVDFDRKDVEDAVLRINGAYDISYFSRGGTDVLLATIP